MGMPSPPSRIRPASVRIVGAGAAAEALGSALSESGLRLGLWARRPARGRRMARRLGIVAARDLDELTRHLGHTDTLLLCVSDQALVEVSQAIAAALPPRRRGPVALHVSGIQGPEALAALAARGVPVGSLHPFVALPRRSATGRRLAGSWFSVAGDDAARRRARALIRSIGARELSLRAGASRARYHAAASLVAGGMVALFEAGREVLEPLVEDPQAGRAALRALAASVLANLGQAEPDRALTGPIARGDVATVERHLEALDGDGRAQEMYRVLGRRLLSLLEGRVEEGVLERLEDTLS